MSYEYCDHCAARLIPGRQGKAVSVLPVNVGSANKGESATLCKKCFHFVRNYPGYKEAGNS